MQKDSLILAFDRSSRHIDAVGRLHVSVTNISKANVCPYRGSEIPGWKELGLDEHKIYQMYRHPDELAKAAHTFNNIQLLSRHVPVTADENPKRLIAGTTGSTCKYVHPYLQNSLVVWDSEDIAGIDAKVKFQLSPGYQYKPVMGEGFTPDNVAYDGIMTDIIGNHLALCEIGRTGSDVVVADESPFKEQTKMATKKELVAEFLKPLLAADAAPDLDALIALAMAKDEGKEPDGDELKDGENEEEYKARMAKKPGKEMAKDEKIVAPLVVGITEDSMNAAIKLAEDSTIARMRDLRTAEKVVAPLVGEVDGMATAQDVYKFALDSLEIDVAGVDPSAYGAMVKMAIANTPKKNTMAHDSGLADELFKNAAPLKRC